LLFLSFNIRKGAILTNFCNPEIPGLEHCHPGIRDWQKRLGFGIPGLQSLGAVIILIL